MSNQSQASGLIALIASAIVCAVAVTAFMVYQWGPSGSYSIRKTLLDPELIPVLSFNAVNAKTGSEDRFVFGKITFSYFNVPEQRMEIETISVQNYSDFYATVNSDRSLAEVSSDIEGLFLRGNPARLLIHTQTESTAKWQEATQVFQEVQFADEGNFYRVQLREEEAPMDEWAYYYHPDITKKTIKLLKPNR